MKEMVAEWVLNLVLFSLLSSLVEKLLPGKSYTSYLRFFCGIMMMITLFSPILSFVGKEDELEKAFSMEVSELEMMQMQKDLLQLEEEWKEAAQREAQEQEESATQEAQEQEESAPQEAQGQEASNGTKKQNH